MCAEYSRLWSTSGVGDGSGSGYTADQLFEIYRALFAGASGANRGGVAPDYGSKLAASGTASPVAIADGAALVYGIPYINATPVSVTIPTPGTATRIDRIVLRASWAAQTVRVTRIAGVEGAGSPPNLQQSAGVTWDIPLVRVSITTGGAVTIADDRQYLQAVGDSGVSTAKIADGAVTNAKLASDSATTAKIVDGNVTNAKLANMVQATIKGRASGDGTGAPGDLSAAQLVTIVTGADGAGSGLDADVVDGYHAAAFAAASHTHNSAEIADNAVANAKLADMAQATVKGRASGAGSGDPGDLSAAQLVTIVTGADGAGSGLDADMVDGYHAAAFAAAAHTHGSTELADNAVTNAKLADMAQATVKGRASGAGSGDPADLTPAQLAAIVAAAGVFAAAPGAWTTLPLTNPVAYDPTNPPQYRLNGDVVEFRGTIDGVTGGASYKVCDIPAGVKPLSGKSHSFAHINTLQQVSMMYVYNNGTISEMMIYDTVAGQPYSLAAIRYSITA